MDDRVGNNNPDPKDLAKLVEEVRALRKKVESFTISLSPEERKHVVTKLRPGADAIVTIVGSQAAKNEIKLPKISVQGMKWDLDLAQMLQPLLNEVTMLHERVEDTVLEAQTEAWWATTAYYAALVRMSAADPELEAALKPAIEFYATGKRRGAPLPPRTTGG
jgi:hypothetical protein